MTKIIKSKSKVAKRYDADIWGFLLRKPSKLCKATNLFNSLGRSSFNVGSEVFAGITRRLYMSKLRRRNTYYKLLRNKARLRLFLGGVNNKHLKNLSIKCWGGTNTTFLPYYLFEARLDCFLYRVHFASSVKEARRLIKAGFFSVNNVVIKHPAYLLKLQDRVCIEDYEYKCNVFLRLHKELQARTLLWYAPPYIDVNYQLFSAVFLDYPQKESVLYPYSINLLQAVDFYKNGI